MNNLLLSNILDVVTIIICVIVTIRICLVYPHVRSPRLLILGLSMGIITLTAIADLLGSNNEGIDVHVFWFLYIGQAVALLYILLSIVTSSDTSLRRIVLFQIFSFVLLVFILLSSFALPDVTNPTLEGLLGSPRFIICIITSIYYLSGFMKKATRFGALMSASFLLLAIGYLMDLQQYLVPLYATLFDGAGDVSRLLGFIALLAAVLGG